MIKEKWPFIETLKECPRCKFRGFSEGDNFCPSCGYDFSPIKEFLSMYKDTETGVPIKKTVTEEKEQWTTLRFGEETTNNMLEALRLLRICLYTHRGYVAQTHRILEISNSCIDAIEKVIPGPQQPPDGCDGKQDT